MAESIEYAAVAVQIVGSLENWDHAFFTDGVRKPTREAAIRHGINTYGHDDFLLAHLRGDVLAMVSWQYEDRPDEDSERAEMAEQCGWSTR